MTTAPAHARLLRDFVNTYDIDDDVDELAAPADLTAWLAERELVPTGSVSAEDDLATAVALRDGLRAAMVANHGPESADRPVDLPAGVEGAAHGLTLRVSLASGRPRLVPAEHDNGVRAGLARIAAAMIAAAADGTWSRLKVCQESTCQWAFFDASKNRSRTWCSMRVCGNRTKTRAYRARRRGQPDRS
jgi:predicted RNA-binding Zn ribbon-like protein